MNGTWRRLSDFKGHKYLLLTFFPAVSPFAAAKSSLRKSHPQLQAADIAVWGVSVDRLERERGQRAYAKHLALGNPRGRRGFCLNAGQHIGVG